TVAGRRPDDEVCPRINTSSAYNNPELTARSSPMTGQPDEESVPDPSFPPTLQPPLAPVPGTADAHRGAPPREDDEEFPSTLVAAKGQRPPTSLLAPEVVPGYEILGELGRR